MKHENNPFNLHVGDCITIKGDTSDQWYTVKGFTEEGYAVAYHDSGLRIPSVSSGMISGVIRGPKNLEEYLARGVKCE